MAGEALQDFAASIALDNQLLRAEVFSDQPIDQAEILSLAAAAQAIFITATLESRQLDEIAKCGQLWREVAALFGELCSAWNTVDAPEPAIAWLKGRLSHYRSLCEDRQELYSVSESERAEHRSRKRDEGWGHELAFGRRADSTQLTGAELARALSPE